MHSNNKLVIAAAGSGKTTFLVQESLGRSSSKILLVTYTIKNKEEIENKFIKEVGYIPKHIIIKTWYSFLLTELIRPYQTCLTIETRINGIFFPTKPSSRYIKKTNIKGYFFNSKFEVNKDRLAELADLIASKTGNKNIFRLQEIYDYMYIDEVQDMSGYDLEIFKKLFDSPMAMLFVGDIRQGTYTTSNTQKNSQYKGINIIRFFEGFEQMGKCIIDRDLNISYRCIQQICDFADNLFPSLERTKSRNEKQTTHNGVFIIHPDDFEAYVDQYSPQCLRYDARTKIDNAINFGESKGLTFDRVLIKPTQKMEKFLKTGVLELEGTSLAKFYVAVTRAKYSVSIISNMQTCMIEGVEFYQPNKHFKAECIL